MRLTLTQKFLAFGAAAAVVIGIAAALQAGGGSDDTAASPPSPSDRGGAIASSGGPTALASLKVGDPAPEFAGLAGWVNSPPLTMKGLRGKVVLVDFWTYTCINCIRTFPFLKAWHEKYADKGLVIVGVHSPEFTFEKDIENVRDAVQRNVLKYPIAVDSDHATWDVFHNQYWPRKFLIDATGKIRFDHIGEGGYEATETWIQRLLGETGADVSNLQKVKDPDPGLLADYRRVTPELYSGLRGVFTGQVGNFTRAAFGIPYEYTLPAGLAQHTIYLKGSWVQREESIRHGRATDDYRDEVFLRFWARSVNLVVRPDRMEPFDLKVTLNGKPLEGYDAGKDVTIDKNGQSFVHIDGPRLYSLVLLPEAGPGDLRFSANDDAFAFFSFTFGVGSQE